MNARKSDRALAEVEPARASEVGLALPSDLGIDEWRTIGTQLARVDRAYRWWIGDWLNYGERNYGDTYTEAIQGSGLEYDTLAKFKWVADRIAIRRRRLISWSHHREVAPLEPDEQDEWLDRAEVQRWTVRELRAWLRARKAKPLPTHKPLLRFCQELPTPIIVAQILRVYFPDAETVVDMTGGDGGFWDGSELIEVTRLIVDPSARSNGAIDFRDLQDIGDETHDVALFDPPHVADAGDESIMGTKFGTYDDMDLEDAVRAGSREAWRVARLGVVVKVTDHVHGQRYVLESDWVREAIGQPPFDEVYQVRSAAVIDPKWEEQLSAYNNGATYLIFRKGNQKHVRR